MNCRLRRVGSGFRPCSSLRGRPRLRGSAGLSGAGGSSLPSLALVWIGFSRASISVASRAIAPMMRPPSARSISAAWILSGSAPRANSANAPENVASEGTCEPRSQPRMRRRDLSTSRRSIRALVMGTPRTAGEGEEAWSVCEPLPVLSASRRAATIGACSRTDDRRFA